MLQSSDKVFKIQARNMESCIVSIFHTSVISVRDNNPANSQR